MGLPRSGGAFPYVGSSTPAYRPLLVVGSAQGGNSVAGAQPTRACLVNEHCATLPPELRSARGPDARGADCELGGPALGSGGPRTPRRIRWSATCARWSRRAGRKGPSRPTRWPSAVSSPHPPACCLLDVAVPTDGGGRRRRSSLRAAPHFWPKEVARDGPAEPCTVQVGCYAWGCGAFVVHGGVRGFPEYKIGPAPFSSCACRRAPFSYQPSKTSTPRQLLSSW